MIDVREYNDRSGRSPYAAWFNRLGAQAAAKVTTALTRMAQGNFSNVKGVGFGVFECRINFGPGYRVYFRQGRRPPRHFARRRHQETPAARRPNRS
jgi:putative component of toxin-antitoxin plasmid stabilization module